MKKVVSLNEKDIENLVKKIMSEDRYQGGFIYNDFRDIVDSVNDRFREYRQEYAEALAELNSRFPIPRQGGRMRTINPADFKV
jgi:hypothetical protein